MVVKSLKSYLYYFSETVWLFGISYRSLVSVLFSCIAWHTFTWCANIYHAVSCYLPNITPCHAITWHATTWHLPLLWFHLSLITCHLSC